MAGTSMAGTSRTYADCAGSARQTVGSGPPTSASTEREERYWLCRRSLRVWPIIGGDLRKSVGDFLKGRLKLDSSFMVTMGDLSVKRVPFTERSKVKNEAVVVFSSVEVRDIVRRSAKVGRPSRRWHPPGNPVLPSVQP